MLQKIRDGANGPLAYIVVAVIAVVFGVWGIGSYFTPSSDPVVASAAGTDITHSQLQRAFNQRYQRLRQMMGDHFDSSMFPPDKIRRNVLNSMIDQAVMTQHAQNAGYRVTDADLLAEIRSNPQFQDNGQFSAQRYKALLSQAGIHPSDYEARLRQGMVAGQVRQVIAASAFAAPPEVDAAYRRAHEQRKIDVLSFNPSAYADGLKIDDAAIQEYYDSHPHQFMRPPRVKLAYVSLDADQLSPSQPDKAHLKKLYQAHKSDFGTPARRSADEVRIPIKEGGEKQARQTVQQVIAAAKKGQSLQQIAASTDGAQYQHIDNQAKSALSDAVGSALFGLKQGALSHPVRDDGVWYVLRATGSTPAKTPKFDDPVVQAQLKAMAHKHARAKAFRTKSDKLDDLAYQAPNDLKTISDKLGLKSQHTGWITRHGGGSGLGQYDAVRKAAFSDAVRKDKLNSKVLDLGDQRRVVLRVIDHQKAQRKPLAEVRDTIHDRLVAQKAQKRARQVTQQAMAKARQGTPLAQIANQDKGTKLRQPGFVARNDDKIDSKLLKAAFSLPLKANQSGATQYQMVSTDDGKIALVGVSASRINGGGSNQKGTQREKIAQRQSGYNAKLEYSALDRYLRQQADVDIKKKALH